MSMPATISEMPPLVVRTRPVFDMTDDEFYAFCLLNPELQMNATPKERKPSCPLPVERPETATLR